MTDEEMIKQLHNVRSEGLQELCWEAADRIEELVKEKGYALERIMELDDRTEALTAKLAKAVEALREISKGPMLGMYIIAWVNSVMKQTRAVLDELEGEK